MHKIGVNLCSNLAHAPFRAKNYGPGWVGGWKSQVKDYLQQSKMQLNFKDTFEYIYIFYAKIGLWNGVKNGGNGMAAWCKSIFYR